MWEFNMNGFPLIDTSSLEPATMNKLNKKKNTSNLK
jgi:hypothetical protein